MSLSIDTHKHDRALPYTVGADKGFLWLLVSVSLAGSGALYWLAQGKPMPLWLMLSPCWFLAPMTLWLLFYRATFTHYDIQVVSLFYERQVAYRDIEEIDVIHERNSKGADFFWLTLKVREKNEPVKINISYNEREIPWILNTVSRLAPGAKVGSFPAQIMRDGKVP